MVSELSGHVALVTGGVRGIGRAISEALMAQGVRVAAGYSRSWSSAEAFLVLHGSHGATVHQGSVGDPADCERVVQEVIDRHGRLDILVNGAGVTMDPTAAAMTPEQWRKAVDANVAGAFAMARAAVPHMVKRRYGRIIGISPPSPAWLDAEAAQQTPMRFELTTDLAMEVAGRGVTVNCITPGPDPGGWHAEGGVGDDRRGDGEPRPQGTPLEVARLVVFLAQPRSGHINGQVYSIEDGLNVRPASIATSTKRSAR